jgi:hypothetical protein
MPANRSPQSLDLIKQLFATQIRQIGVHRSHSALSISATWFSEPCSSYVSGKSRGL